MMETMLMKEIMILLYPFFFSLASQMQANVNILIQYTMVGLSAVKHT